MRKKFLILLLALTMIMAFTACGGGSGEEAPAEPEASEEPLELNAGVKDIVFAVPNGYEVYSLSKDANVAFSIPGTAFIIGVDTISSEVIKEMGGDRFSDIQDYYEKAYKVTKDQAKEENLEAKTIKVLDTDASYVKRLNGDNGAVSISTGLLSGDNVYDIFISSPNMFDYSGDTPKLKENLPVLGDEEIKMYDAVVASVQSGDGNAVLNNLIASTTVDSLGSMSFEAPAGFTLKSMYETGVTFGKDGCDIEFYINLTRPEDLQNITLENGKHPSSIEDYYNTSYFFEGMDTEKIGGFDGYLNKYPDEDGKYYNIGGGFLADDGIYDFTMDAQAYDWENDGTLKEGAEALSDDDVAAFDNFVASLKKK